MRIVKHDMSKWAKEWTPRDIKQITDVVTHHSDMASNASPDSIDAAEVSKGSFGGGYNYYITGDGTLYILRPLNVLPAADYGRNLESINICLAGDFTHAQPTQAQKTSWTWLVHTLFEGRAPTGTVTYENLETKLTQLYGHRDVATHFHPENEGDYSTACPGDSFYSVYKAEWIPYMEKLLGRKVALQNS